MFCGVELFIACFGVVLCGMLIFFFRAGICILQYDRDWVGARTFGFLMVV
jgi:hypothetical protein